MIPSDLSPKPFVFTDPRQRRIFTRLQNLVGPGPALFYRDACLLMASELPTSSTTHLVAHLLRDIESALRDVLETFVDPKVLKELRKDSGEINHRNEVLVILSALELSDDVELKELWLGLTGKKNVRALHSRAHRNALASPRPMDSDFRSFWLDMELILDTVLNRFESKYLKIHERLAILKEKQNPGNKDAKFLHDHISNNFAAFSYFFQDLDNPAWLKPLAKEGVFSYPPVPIINLEDNTISHPLWPQSRFLAKMAAISPDVVAQIALKIETENSNVQSDLVDVACALPASLAVKFVPKLNNWLKRPLFFISHKISPLIVNLAKNGEVTGALMLCKELLGFEGVNVKEEEKYGLDPRSRIQPYEFEEFTKDTLPVVVRAEPYGSYSMLAELMSEAVIGGKYRLDTDYRDYSEIWRPAIEPHSQNSNHPDVKNLLVSAIRDAATYLLEKSPERFEVVLQELENRKWTIFIRLALHLLREFGDKHIDMVSKRILDKTLYDSSDCYHEYMLLASKYFRKLRTGEKTLFLSWIESDDDGEDYQEYRQLRRLSIIKDSLPKRWKVHYDTLTKKHGEVEHADLLSWSSGVMSGPTSPISQEQIEEMSLQDLVTYLQLWKQPTGFTMESPEGISRTLTPVVANNPERYALSSSLFTKVHPTYVRGILAGFREALKAGRSFEWEPILKFMKWIVGQNRNETVQIISDKEDLDPDWGWTRKEISRLLEDALNNNKNPISYEQHSLVWEVIEPITNDPDPTTTDENKSQMDPATNSLNTIRGMAFHALIAYALWRKRNIKSEHGKKEIGLKEIPEIQKVLDEHLDILTEPSLTIRSIFGWRFINLLWLDRNWALTKKSQIFPHSEDERSYWKASWDAFISFTNPSADLYQNLQFEYQLAVNRLSKVDNKVGWGTNTGERLAEHLMILYAWGTLELTSLIMVEFWEKADISFRSHALHFVGTTTKEDAPLNFVNRFKELWENRIAKAEAASQNPDSAEEMKEFGWWIASGAFPDEWSLDQLSHVTNLFVKVEGDYFVFERLATLSTKYPLQTTKLLDKLLQDETPWRIQGSKEQIETILKNALESKDINTSKMASEFINRLAAKGYTNFSHLLSE